MIDFPKNILSYSEGIKKVEKYNLIVAVGEESFFRDQIKNKKISLEKDSDIVKIDCSEKSESFIF